MGYTSARDMADQVDIDTALGWHLQSNHYPPIPSAMIPIAKQAIEAFMDGDSGRLIDLGDIVEYRGSTSAPAWALAEHMHLQAFIDQAMDEEE